MLSKKLITLIALCSLSACSTKYVWTTADGSPATAKDMSDCRSASNKGAKSRQLAAPVEVSANGTILPTQRSVAQNNFRSSQVFQQCMSSKGYEQTSAE